MPYYSSKHHIWNEIHNLFDTLHDPWSVIGDFNDIIYPSEKLEGQLIYFNDNNCLTNFMHSIRDVDLGITRS